MTILIAWPNLVPVTHAGAVRGMAFVKAAAALGLSPITITPSITDPTIERWDGMHISTLRLYDSYASLLPPPFPALLLPLTIARLSAIAKKNRVRAVVSSTPGLFLALECLFVARLLGIPFFLDIRDSWALEEISHTGLLRNRVKSRLEWILCHGAVKVWTVTESLARLLCESHRFPSNRVQVVPNGADLSVFSPIATQKKYDLVFLGAPSPYEDPSKALESFLCLSFERPSLRVLWLGWERATLTDSARSALNMLVSKGFLKLSPRVPNSEVPSILAEARIGVASLCEEEVYRTAIGAKVYEYIASGLPLASLGPPGKSELRSLIEAYGVGFFATTPKDFASLASQILTDEKKLKSLRERCLTVSKRFDRGQICLQALRNFVVPYLNRTKGTA